MKYRHTAMLLIFITAMAFIPISATASSPPGIWLQKAVTGNQSWAYYPFYPAHPWSGGNWSAPNTGTSGVPVEPGMAIGRKIIVHCSLPLQSTVNIMVSGLPSSWTVKVSVPALVSGVTIRNGLGYSSFYAIPPPDAAPGNYDYTITARSGTNYTSTITDTIVVDPASPAGNLLVNPGFESGMAGWTNVSFNEPRAGPGGIVELSPDAHNGSASLHLECGDGGPGYAQHRPYAAAFQPLSLAPGSNISVSFWSKGSPFQMLFGSIGDPLGPWAAVDVAGSPGWTYHTINWSYHGYPQPSWDFRYGILPYVGEERDVYIDDITVIKTS